MPIDAQKIFDQRIKFVNHHLCDLEKDIKKQSERMIQSDIVATVIMQKINKFIEKNSRNPELMVIDMDSYTRLRYNKTYQPDLVDTTLRIMGVKIFPSHQLVEMEMHIA